MSRDTTYIQGKVALLYKTKERALRLLSSAVEVFRQVELRGREALQLSEMEDEQVQQALVMWMMTVCI